MEGKSFKLITISTVLYCTFVIDLSISINISFPNHLVYFLVCELFSQVSHYMTQLCCANVTVSILVSRETELQSVTQSVNVTIMPNRRKNASP